MISILTTVYNGYEFLGECAKSILTQQDHYGDLTVDWEWWIGLNGHEEGSEGAAASAAAAMAVKVLDPRIHVVNLNVRGRVPALNALKKSARGEWIAILDCDDIWEPEKLITQIAAIRMNHKIDVIGTFCTYFGDLSGSPSLPSGWITGEDIRVGNPIINSSVLMRSELAIWEDRYGLEDYDLWIRLQGAGKGIFNVPHSLVRHRVHGQSAFNGKGGQDINGLRLFHGLIELRPTVVSAYYPIRSKYSVEEYIRWILQFWPQIPCNLVFYTEPILAPVFEDAFRARASTRVVGLPFSSLAAFQKLSPLIWNSALSLDTEKAHTPELYALWYEKKEFVLRAIELNPFQSNEFVWCDAGIGRQPLWTPMLSSFPLRKMIPCGKMLLLQIDPFKEEDFVVDEHGIPGNFGTRATFGGGILASDIDGWNRWSKAYDAMFLRYYLSGRFVGKDQNIIGSIVLEKPELMIFVKRPDILGPIDGWFYLLLFLSGLIVS
jgi:glycosyltransferase involved in cell wall biosynthesis